ncbi:MAG: prepilin-type N-terminal cleavage/methylation domain-containing protein [Pseudomonadota bacterium]
MQKKHKKPHEKKGFSLIELSIVILIVSILITGSLGISKTAINNSKAKITKDRMSTVYQALSNFLATNRRLPCPAIITIAKGSTSGTTTTPNNMTYGQETGAVTTATVGTGVCNYSYVSSTNAPNLVYGAVPIIALGLDPDIAEDGWGTKFTYVVDKRFTKQSVGISASDGFEITPGVPNDIQTSSTDLSGIDVQGPSGTLLLSNRNGVLLLLSHGANKFNGFNATGTGQNGTGVTDENENSCNTCSVSGLTSFNRIFLANSTDPNFDDISLFKTKTQLVRDAGLQFLMCSSTEATATGPISWANNGSYSCSVCATGGGTIRTCGTYGSWGASSTSSCSTNSTVCPVSRNTLELISTQTLVANSTTVTFSSIPNTFTHLRIIGYGRMSSGGTAALRLNGDATAANYISQFIRAFNTSAAAGYSAAGTYTSIPISDWTNVASYASMFEVVIPLYNGTSLYKAITSVSGSSNSTGAGSITETWSGTWKNTAAITSVTLVELSGGSFATGSVFSLYGMY